ncbi:hypothetical protein N9D31_01245 [Oligoflexaceae bacterium]|nr:hypothetical protein [Oligoflexaceae bacterium]
MIRTPFNCLPILIFCFAAAAQASDGQAKTDLGPGNAYVGIRFANFQNQAQHCKIRSNNTKRIILTGFGAFQGRDNFSGELVRFMAGASKRSPRPRQPNTFGAEIYQRLIEIEGEEFDVCFLRLDVLWDLAGAIVTEEMNRFRPEGVFMTGVGNSSQMTIEAGGSNRVQLLNGYSHFGSVLHGNVPTSSAGRILDFGPDTVTFSWDRQNIAAHIRDSEAGLGVDIATPFEPRSANGYICNNSAYIVASAVNGFAITLAGERIQLSYHHDRNIPMGFLHLPKRLRMSQENFERWQQILMMVMYRG